MSNLFTTFILSTPYAQGARVNVPTEKDPILDIETARAARDAVLAQDAESGIDPRKIDIVKVEIRTTVVE